MSRFRPPGLLTMAALLFCIYVMTSSGQFHIIDEVSLYAVTESLALRGETDTNAIAWTQWVNNPGEVLGAFGQNGDVFSKKGPAPAFAAAPWYWLIHLATKAGGDFGQLQLTLLWNSVVTAATAWLLALTARRLGYGPRTGVALGLLFGLAGMAWPYAKQFFGEPWSAFSLLLLFYGLLSWRSTRQQRWLVCAGLGAGLAIAAVTAHAAVVLLWAAADWMLDRRKAPARAQRPTRSAITAALALLTPLATLAGGVLVYNWLRFGNLLATGYHFDSGEGFTTPLWQGLWGQLISPYRGVFWHMPLLAAVLPASVFFARRHRRVAVGIAAATATLLLLYSAWWMWWGGFSWGPRFLTPLTPLWVLLLAPIVARLSGDNRAAAPRWAVGLLIVAAALSVVVQVGAVVVNYVNYETLLRTLYPTDPANQSTFGPPAQALRDLMDSPVLGQWKLLRADVVANTDLAWLWANGAVLWPVVGVGMLVIATLATLLTAWWRSSPSPRSAQVSWPAALLALLLPGALLVIWGRGVAAHPVYGQPGRGYRAALEVICANVRADDVLVTVAPEAYQIPMNWLPQQCKLAPPILGLAANSMEHPEAQPLLHGHLARAGRIWLVTGGYQPSDPQNTVERWLAGQAYKASDDWRDDYRVVQYATAASLEGVEPTDIVASLSGSRGEQVTVLALRAPAVVRAGLPMPIEITYQLDASTGEPLRWFVQLWDGQNRAIAALDTGPEDNYTSFARLPVHHPVLEKAGLLVPAATPPGEYQIILGLYNPDNGMARLMTAEDDEILRGGAVRVTAGD